MKHNFLIESDHLGMPLHDFGFQMIEACRYKNWFNGNKDYHYYLTRDIFEYDFTDWIPIGSIEWTHKFLKEYYKIPEPKPINIPKELMVINHTKRICYVIDRNEMNFNGPRLLNGQRFVKSMDKIKSFTEIVYSQEEVPDGKYLVSHLINISSEWRCFVFNGKLIGLKNYSGDFTIFPDIQLINNMINNYKNCPPVYTLDIGINESDGTFLIEIHNFYSCGLYGFSDYRVLPDMFEKSFKWIINQYKEGNYDKFNI